MPVSRSEVADPRVQLIVGGSLVVLAGLAWAWTVAMAAMPECHRVGIGSFVPMWTVMMAAMMFPAVIPVVLAFMAFTRTRGAAAGVSSLLFLAGYLVVWGLLALPAQALLAGAARVAAAVPGLAWSGGAI